MDIQLVPVDLSQKEKLSDLLMVYEKELTGSTERYKYLDSYFTDKDRHPFFILLNNIIVGFVLVNKFTVIEEDAYSIGEFFVAKEYRKKGIGKEAAFKAFNLFPGKWELRELENNIQGQEFWRKVIEEYTNNNFTEQVVDSDKWKGPLQIFESK